MKLIPNESYQYSTSFKNQGSFMLVVGIVLFFIAAMLPDIAFSAVSSGAGLLIGMGVLNIVLYGDKSVLKVYDSYFELKAAPAAPLKIIKFDTIKRVSLNKKIISIFLKSTEKPIKLHTRLLNKTDVAGVVKILQDVIV